MSEMKKRGIDFGYLTLLHKECSLCYRETYEEGGFVQCDCIKIDKEAWANGVSDTPKEWVDLMECGHTVKYIVYSERRNFCAICEQDALPINIPFWSRRK